AAVRAGEGGARSGGSTGSQITKTRMSLPLFSRRSCPVAEAPCRQMAQVGDSRTRMRVEEAEALNTFLSGVRSPEEKRTNGACPLGVELPPYNMYAIPNAPAANTTNNTLFFMVYLPVGPPPGSRPPGGRRQTQKPRSLKTTTEKCWFGCACRHIAWHATICKKQKRHKQRIPPAGTAEVARRRLRRLRLQ